MGSQLDRALLTESRISPEIFVERYLDHLDKVEAVRSAVMVSNPGFLENQATTRDLEDIATLLLSDRDVLDNLNTRLSQAVQTTRLVSSQYVLNEAQSVYEKCVQREYVKDREGNPVIGKFQPVAALRALELIGKHTDIQAFKEVIEIDTGPNLAETLANARKRLENESRVIDVTPESELLGKPENTQTENPRPVNESVEDLLQ